MAKFYIRNLKEQYLSTLLILKKKKKKKILYLNLAQKKYFNAKKLKLIYY